MLAAVAALALLGALPAPPRDPAAGASHRGSASADLASGVLMSRTADPRPPVLEPWRALLALLVVPAAWAYLYLLGVPPVQAAEPPAYLAVALVCPAGVAAPDCTRANAVDVLTQPVPMVTACAQVGQLLAVHLILEPGQRHKVGCERRKG